MILFIAKINILSNRTIDLFAYLMVLFYEKTIIVK